ncbi:MAG: M12 family metallo-peptidase, partial [Hyphomicrobium sp.]
QSIESMPAKQQQMMHATMESKSVMGMSMMALPDPRVLEYALTKGMSAAGNNAVSTPLVIPLNDTITITARRISITKTSDGYVWHGAVAGSGEPVTLLWWASGRLSGSITYKGHIYSVRNIGGGMHGVVDMMPSGLPPEHAPMDPGTMKKMNIKEDPFVHKGDASMMPDAGEQTPVAPSAPSKRDRSGSKELEDAPLTKQAYLAPAPAFEISKHTRSARNQEPVVISVLVAYTKKAASYFGDLEKDLIALAIEDANQSFRNSGINHVTLELVHAYQTDYAEDGSHFEHVFRFADKDDGYMDDVHSLRERYRADVSILVVHDPNGCGLAAQVAAPADRAFAVVHHECAATSYSLGHEIGHLIGARHDEALDDSKDPFPFGHGFVFGKKWRTMMSYKDSCDGCPRLPVWSNPDVKIQGVRAGTKTSNNARVIAEKAARVAAFR